MNVNRDTLEDQLQDYEAQLKSLNSYMKELQRQTDKHGTDEEHYETDRLEAEHNVKYYEDEIARLKNETGHKGKGGGSGGGGGRGGGGGGVVLPPKVKQGLMPVILSSISFVAGAPLGSTLRARRQRRGGR
ncbi:MAG TPA: hypothetical protein VK363_08155 [Pyrinomonadaceae bacterium]|nr:hypothetical protein [Pyrinomonadaceae bacterium]